MLIPKINWISFDKENPPKDLAMGGAKYLIFLREDDYDNGATWTYSVDIAEPYGSYLDNFWDTENDWKEGQRVEVLAYANFPYMLHEEECNNYSNLEYIDILKGSNKTIQEILDTMNKEQKAVVYALITMVMKECERTEE